MSQWGRRKPDLPDRASVRRGMQELSSCVRRQSWLALFLSGAACSPGAPSPFAPSDPSAQPSEASVAPPSIEDAGAFESSTPIAIAPVAGARAPLPSVALVRIASDLTKPVQVVPHGEDLYVVQQTGRIVRIDRDGSRSTVIDLSAELRVGAETGLLGMALHPKFEQNGRVFVYYTAPPPEGGSGIDSLSILARFETYDGGLTLDPGSEMEVLSVEQPADAHKGGTIGFGNDGYLYWSLGDGAWGFDPFNTAQDRYNPLGSIVRIDVDSSEPYAIPPDNPFAAGGGLPEIFATGFRNPFRFSFDRATGALWVGDVGEGAREEIDLVVPGGDYGWPVREGSTCFAAESCRTQGLIDPVVEHGRDQATAIIGGVVYRGSAIPALAGSYVYGDWASGALFAFAVADAAPTASRLVLVGDPVHPTSFALDAAGEILVSSFDGAIYRVVPSESVALP